MLKIPPRWRSKPIAIVPVLILAALASACGGSDGADIQEPLPVTAVTITAPSTTVDSGQTLQLTATARNANGAVVEGRTSEWTTVDAAVASVSSSGLVTGLKPGPVEIRASTEGVTGSILITIAAAPPVVPPPLPPPPPGPVTLGLQPVVTGLDFPLYLTSPPGDERLFIVQKGGVIRVVKGGALLPTPFLDLTSKVFSDGGEQGLLGLVFAPDYAASGRFFVQYTGLDGDTRISRLRVSADPDRADPASESLVLLAPQPGVAHKGGQLLFGPDGMLYIGLGDGGDNDQGRGQSRADLLGSILRIDVSSGASYTVPPDNPFIAAAGARPEIWSYGLRNPWRFSFDRANGDLYIGDVGESNWEEVDYASAANGAGRGVNYGWSRMEGQHCFGRADCDQTGLTLPVLEYQHSDGCSVISGYVYRGAAIPALQGTYFYADFCDGWVRSFRMEGGALVDRTDWPELEPGGRVTSFGEDAAGELYLVTAQGGVFKIVAE
ncbi:MAG: PQQ-dependent sugar dehydrogenase [Gemmatimonadales bacterium]